MGQSRSLSWLVGGWQINGILSAVSGSPFYVTSSGTSLNAPGSAQRADQVKEEVEILGGAGRGQSYFDPLAYRAVTDARFGTAGFNSLRGPGIFNLDMGLFREFRMTERLQMQFRGGSVQRDQHAALRESGHERVEPSVESGRLDSRPRRLYGNYGPREHRPRRDR